MFLGVLLVREPCDPGSVGPLNPGAFYVRWGRNIHWPPRDACLEPQLLGHGRRAGGQGGGGTGIMTQT